MNIYLIGYRGTGKTSLGRILSLKLKRRFVDTDDLITEREGMTIPQLFSEKGEEFFRQAEHEIIEELSERKDLIVATGGGIVIRDDNREILKSTGYCILLTAEPEIILTRIGGDKNRPALTDHQSELDEITAMLNKRKDWYHDVANTVVNTGDNGIKSCVNNILEHLSQHQL